MPVIRKLIIAEIVVFLLIMAVLLFGDRLLPPELREYCHGVASSAKQRPASIADVIREYITCGKSFLFIVGLVYLWRGHRHGPKIYLASLLIDGVISFFREQPMIAAAPVVALAYTGSLISGAIVGVAFFGPASSSRGSS